MEKPIPYTTSAWVIQESGYAIAQCKKVIFLFEEPVITRLGLQADSEYLIFDRNKPLDDIFTKLNEMLVGIQNNNYSNNVSNAEINKVPTNRDETITAIENVPNQNNQDEHKINLVANLHCSNKLEIVKQIIDSTKTKNSNRTLPMSKDVERILRHARKLQAENKMKLGPKYHRDLDLVFPREDGYFT